MPLDPLTWSPFDQVTATRLNNDLYVFDGYAFYPNGVLFHARRPLYKATQCTTGLVVEAGQWRGMFETQGANVLTDTAGYYGAHMDPDYSGTISDAVAYSNGSPIAPNPPTGNLIGAGGGWYLVSAFIPLNGAGGSMYRANIAEGTWTNNDPNLTGTGTAQGGNSARDICPFIVDLVNFASGTYTAVIDNTSPSNAPLQTNIDGSGETCYFTAQWVSIYKQNGFTAAQPAPQSSWTSSSTVTAGLLNGSNGIRDVLRVLNMPPIFKASAASSQAVSNNAATTLSLSSLIDTYNGWNGGTSTYTVPFGGLYLAYGVATWQEEGNAIPARAAVNVNGTNYWGPYSNMPAGAGTNACAKLAILDLQGGDTVQLVGQQESGSSNNTASNIPSVLILVWMGRHAAPPSSLPDLPDLSYRYTAGMGTAATLTAFNDHLANDLNFLTYKPYLLSTQQNSQSVPQAGTGGQLTMDTIGGIVHNSTGDPYGGWDATHHRYVAPVSGWYLATMEVFFGTPTLTSSPSTVALFQISGNANTTQQWDWYQHMNLPTAVAPGGAAGYAYYYLRAGDWITPGVITQDTASGNFPTSTSQNSHFECVWVSEG